MPNTTRITDSDGNSISVGQTTMAGSLSVVIASNQDAIPISGTITPSGTQTVAGTVTSVSSGTQTVTGTVTAVPTGTQAVSGTVTNVPSGTQTVAGTVTNVPSGTQTVAGTVTAVTSGNNTVVGAAASGAAKSGNPVQVGHVFNTTQPTVTSGQAVEGQATARGALIVATGVDAFTVAGTVTSVPSGTQTVTGTVAATGTVTAVPTGTQAVSGTVTTVPSGTQTVTGTLTAVVSGTQISGDVAHDTADSGNPVKVGGQARTTNPTAVADGDRSHIMTDKMGRQVVVASHVRDLVVTANLVLTTTTETTLIAAGGAGVFHDLVFLNVSNSDNSPVDLIVRDVTAGTVVMRIALSRAQSTGGASSIATCQFVIPWPQTTANNNWTVQLSAATTSVYVFAQFVKNI